MMISGPHKGRVFEVPATLTELTPHDLALINSALDQVLASLDRLERQIGESTRAFEERSRA
jgi:hypothetical protein